MCGAYAFANLLEVRQRAFAAVEILVGKKQGRPAEEYLVAINKRSLPGYSSAVDEYAVPTLHIEGAVPAFAVVVADLQVLSRDEVVKYLDRDGLCPANYVCPAAEWVVVALPVAGGNDDRSHFNSLFNCRQNENHLSRLKCYEAAVRQSRLFRVKPPVLLLIGTACVKPEVCECEQVFEIYCTVGGRSKVTIDVVPALAGLGQEA